MTITKVNEFLKKLKQLEKEYDVTFHDYKEEVKQGKVTFIRYTLILKVD